MKFLPSTTHVMEIRLRRWSENCCSFRADIQRALCSGDLTQVAKVCVRLSRACFQCTPSRWSKFGSSCARANRSCSGDRYAWQTRSWQAQWSRSGHHLAKACLHEVPETDPTICIMYGGSWSEVRLFSPQKKAETLLHE